MKGIRPLKNAAWWNVSPHPHFTLLLMIAPDKVYVNKGKHQRLDFKSLI
jgi:hypothetical protein